MRYGKITAETAKMIGGLNAVVYVNAGGSIMIEIPYALDADPSELCAILYQTLGDRDELFPVRKKRITGKDFGAINDSIEERAKKHPPVNFDLVAHSLDGSHTHNVKIAAGTDWIRCNCGSVLFTIAFAEFDDWADGVIVQCQECGQILEIQKD